MEQFKKGDLLNYKIPKKKLTDMLIELQRDFDTRDKEWKSLLKEKQEWEQQIFNLKKTIDFQNKQLEKADNKINQLHLQLDAQIDMHVEVVKNILSNV